MKASGLTALELSARDLDVDLLEALGLAQRLRVAVPGKCFEANTISLRVAGRAAAHKW